MVRETDEERERERKSSVSVRVQPVQREVGRGTTRAATTGLAEGEPVDERLFQATTLLALRPELSSSASSRLGPRSRVSVAATPATVSQSIGR